jgi:hypothetical protein
MRFIFLQFNIQHQNLLSAAVSVEVTSRLTDTHHIALLSKKFKVAFIKTNPNAMSIYFCMIHTH